MEASLPLCCRPLTAPSEVCFSLRLLWVVSLLLFLFLLAAPRPPSDPFLYCISPLQARGAQPLSLFPLSGERRTYFMPLLASSQQLRVLFSEQNLKGKCFGAGFSLSGVTLAVPRSPAPVSLLVSGCQRPKAASAWASQPHSPEAMPMLGLSPGSPGVGGRSGAGFLQQGQPPVPMMGWGPGRSSQSRGLGEQGAVALFLPRLLVGNILRSHGGG